MKLSRRISAFAAVLFLGAAAAVAGDKWVTVAELVPTPGKAKEVAINKVCSFIQFSVEEGSVGFATFWIREPNGVKNQITVNASFAKGQKYTLPIDNPRMISSLRISDNGNGRYRVWVKER